jgi:hypothetical protein
MMPYTKSPRPYKHEYEKQKERGEHPDRMERQRARRKMDASSPDKNGNGKADKREGKDIDHVKPLSKGGTNAKSNLKLKTPSANRSFSRNSDHTVKVNKPKK